MAEMAELCELYEECNDQQMDVMPGEGDLPQMEVGGGGSREAALSAPRSGEEGPMEEEEGLEGEDEAEELDDWEDDYDYPEKESSRAREAALDGGFQMHYEKTPFDQLAFIEELFSLMVVNRLTEELGCDEMIDKE
uniref:EP300 interacting inhibitor of differentiation 1 n=1 Tax=Cavia porcellus TaxID=10141 RepID=A0A286XYX1_CAVPO